MTIDTLDFLTPNNPKARAVLHTLWNHLSRRLQIRIVLLIVLMFITAISESLSVGALVPILTSLTKSGTSPTPAFLFFARLPIRSNHESIIVFLFIILVIIAAILRLFTLYLNGKYAALIGIELNSAIFTKYLNQPYANHLRESSSPLIAITTNYIDSSVMCFTSLFQLLTAILISLSILFGLLFISLVPTIVLLCIFTLLYAQIAFLSRETILSTGKQVSIATQGQIQLVNEAHGGIRDIILASRVNFFSSVFTSLDLQKRTGIVITQFMGTYPRYLLEALGVILLSIIGVIILFYTANVSTAVTTVGTLGFGFQRILPSLQQIYNNWTTIQSFKESLFKVSSYLQLHEIMPPTAPPPLVPFCKSIRLTNITYAYSGNSTPVLNDVSFTIYKGDRIGILGPSGCGKSTLVDILLGLLIPLQGSVFVDELPVNTPQNPSSLKSWQQLVAHVPQNVYLSDKTMLENIAFGIDYSLIDVNKAVKAATTACIDSFISSLPNGYDSYVGERGSQISSGQRQRIGIARALYLARPVLVLDEALTAVDVDTERSIFANILATFPSLTILIISHRSSTLNYCQRFLQL